MAEITNGTAQHAEETRIAPKPSAAKKVDNGHKPMRAPKKRCPKRGGARKKRSFPNVTLEDALKVAQVIKQKNGGHPWATAMVSAAACNTKPMTNKFFYLSSAASDYGLTVGGRNSPQIELTPLGRSIVYASTQDEEQERKIEAFLKVEKFKQVFDHYTGSVGLPEKQYLSNALESQFQLPPAEHDEFTKVFRANCKYLGIENGLGKATHAMSGTKIIDVRSMGKPKGEFDKTAFVIMPFSEKAKPERSKGFFDEVLKSVITPAGNAAGFAVETARREDSDIIHHTILKELLNVDLVIADLTDHNPNVLFELGIRIAVNKPIVLIKSRDTGPIFDVDNLLRVYHYDQNLWKSTVEGDVKALTERVTGTWDNREHSVSYMQILTTGQQPHGVVK